MQSDAEPGREVPKTETGDEGMTEGVIRVTEFVDHASTESSLY